MKNPTHHYGILKALCSLLLGFCFSLNCSATTWYVKASGDDTKDGKSWANAFQTLQKAIDVAAQWDEIRVAKGTYLPTKEADGTTDSQREFTFYFDKVLYVKGGYDAATGNRNYTVNKTYLSGDFNEDDIGFTNNDENAFTVIHTKNVSSSFLMDGFVIKGGNSDEIFPKVHSDGGGWYNDGSGSGNVSSPLIKNCSFQFNYASKGGALYNKGNSGESSPHLTSCNFHNNKAGSRGAAMYNFGTNGKSSPIVANCSFHDNFSSNYGGALYNSGVEGESSPILANCSFHNNEAQNGGALYNDGSDDNTSESSPILMNCTFHDNKAAFGGAMYNLGADGECTPEIKNCIFWQNNGHDGSIHNDVSNPQIIYSLIQENACPTGATCGAGMIYAKDPKFTDASTGDLSLSECSPVIDEGLDSENMVPSDILGNNRKFDTFSGGEKIDMGAFEYQNTIPAPVAKCKSVAKNLDPNTGTVTVNANELDNSSSGSCLNFLMNGAASVEYDCSDISSIHLITLKATDAFGRTSTCNTQIFIKDVTKPSFSYCPSYFSKSTDAGKCTATVTWSSPTATDDCDSSPAINQTMGPSSGSTFSIGIHTIKYTAQDNSGNNSSECSFTIAVYDGINPVLTSCPSNISKSMDAGQCDATVSWTPPSASDNCDPSPTISQIIGQSSGSTFLEGTHTIKYTAKDNSNNVSTACSFTITVAPDAEKPNAQCQNHTVQLDANGNASITTSEIDNNSTDNCSIASFALDITSFDCNDVGDVSVNLTVKDSENNSETCTATVTVQDNIKPNAQCQNKTIQLDNNGIATITAAEIDNNSTDACGIKTLALDITSFDCNDLGSHTVTLTVTDNNDNQKTCDANITVEDKLQPEMTCPSNITQEMDAGQCGATVNWTSPSATDNCDANPTINQTAGSASGSFFSEGPETIKYSATDASGNVSVECSFTVTVEGDAEKPNFNGSCASYPTAFNTDTGQCYSTINFTLPNPTDNCGIAELKAKIWDSNNNVVQNWTTNPDGQYGPDTYQIKWRAKDAAGNKKICATNFTVQDVQDPDAKCVASHIVQLSGGIGSITANDIDAGSSDNCNYNLSLSKTSFDCNDRGTQTVTMTATDDAGNTDQCTTDIEIKGTTLSIDDVTQNEGNGTGFTFYFFKIERAASGCAAQVDYETTDGDATLLDNDYVYGSGTVYYPPGGSNIRYVICRATKDNQHENDEDFWVEMSNPSIGLSFTKDKGEAMIMNDDTVPLIGNHDAQSTDYQILEGKANLYPNPVTRNLTISTPFHWFEKGSIRVALLDILGRRLSAFDLTEDHTVVDVTVLMAGQYELVFMSEDGRRQSERFVKID